MIDIEILKENFHFLRPKLLYALVPVVAVFLLTWLTRRKKEKWIRLIPEHLRPYMVISSSNRSLYLARFALLFIMCLMVVMMAGPTWQQQDIPGKKNESVLLIILDLSQSMMATDLAPNRLERAKFKIRDLLKTNPRCRVGLVAFAGTAHMVVPFSDQYQAHLLQLQNMVPAIMPLKGTDLSYAFKMTDTLMSRFKAPSTVWLITDDLDENAVKVLKDFTTDTPHTIALTTLATPQGAIVPGTKAISKLNVAAVKELSGNPKIRTTVFTLDNTDVEKLVEQIRKNQTLQDKPNSKQSIWIDQGPFLFWLLLPLGALWFRRGWRAVCLLPFLVQLSSCGNLSTDDLWFTKNYQGQKLMKQGKYNEAAKKFQDPAHKAIAYMKAGSEEKAVEYFEKDSTATSFYNEGLVYAKSGDYNAAANAFSMAVNMDSSLIMAKENLDEVKNYLKKRRFLKSELPLNKTSTQKQNKVKEQRTIKQHPKAVMKQKVPPNKKPLQELLLNRQ